MLVNRAGVWRDQYPHQMGVMLAVVLQVSQAEAQVPREIRVSRAGFLTERPND